MYDIFEMVKKVPQGSVMDWEGVYSGEDLDHVTRLMEVSEEHTGLVREVKDAEMCEYIRCAVKHYLVEDIQWGIYDSIAENITQDKVDGAMGALIMLLNVRILVK